VNVNVNDMPIPRDNPRATGPSSSTSPGWASQQVAAMVDAWAAGNHVKADDLLAAHPGIDTESALRLIFEEVCLRRETGLEVDTTAVVGRYPQWGRELRALFDCERLLRPSGPVVALPEIGETLGPFLLRAELGRGASGRTFLATDSTLADRPVVVKVVPGDQVEHLALASLRHTHIVPLFSLQTFPERGLLGLCMPYLGGASLAGILDDLTDLPVAGRSGRLLVELIDRATPSSPAAPRAEGPFRRGLEGASYVQAVTWIGSCLADALHYAHARGLVHMDVKPSNVLITADGQPMLLDFHLARAPIGSGERVAGRLGGTPGWMSPEQEAALAAVARGRPVPAAVDGRSDLFALGLLLRQALFGSRTRSGRDRPVGVGLGLADIIRKCLDPNPGRRYPDAAALADDLRRDLDNRPLRGVRNRDPLERLQKVRRRHPGALAWGLAGLVLAAATIAAAFAARAAYRERVSGLASALTVGRAARTAGRFDEAIRSLRHGLERARPTPGVGGLRGELEAELRRAERGRHADELRALANRVRFQYGIALPPPAEGRSLEALCRALWDRRRSLLDADGHPLTPAVEQRIRTDLLELAAIVADLGVGLAAPSEADAAKRQALGWLDQVEAELGPSLALEARRCRWARDPAGVRPLPLPRASAVWEHYDLGRFLLRDGRTEAAVQAFRRAVALCPEDFWSNFYEGLCEYRIGRFEPAVAAFRTCVALEPGSAVCRYNRALALEAFGRIDEAEVEYTQAVERDPNLAAALLNRGILAYKAGRARHALADFERALQGRSDRATRARIHYNLALAQIATGDRTSACRNVERASFLGCPEARTLSARLR
jgi:tetratricopeptide (TPR) repeat protein